MSETEEQLRGAYTSSTGTKVRVAGGFGIHKTEGLGAYGSVGLSLFTGLAVGIFLVLIALEAVHLGRIPFWCFIAAPAAVACLLGLTFLAHGVISWRHVFSYGLEFHGTVVTHLVHCFAQFATLFVLFTYFRYGILNKDGAKLKNGNLEFRSHLNESNLSLELAFLWMFLLAVSFCWCYSYMGSWLHFVCAHFNVTAIHGSLREQISSKLGSLRGGHHDSRGHQSSSGYPSSLAPKYPKKTF